MSDAAKRRCADPAEIAKRVAAGKGNTKSLGYKQSPEHIAKREASRQRTMLLKRQQKMLANFWMGIAQ